MRNQTRIIKSTDKKLRYDLKNIQHQKGEKIYQVHNDEIKVKVKNSPTKKQDLELKNLEIKVL